MIRSSRTTWCWGWAGGPMTRRVRAQQQQQQQKGGQGGRGTSTSKPGPPPPPPQRLRTVSTPHRPLANNSHALCASRRPRYTPHLSRRLFLSARIQLHPLAPHTVRCRHRSPWTLAAAARPPAHRSSLHHSPGHRLVAAPLLLHPYDRLHHRKPIAAPYLEANTAAREVATVPRRTSITRPIQPTSYLPPPPCRHSAA